MSSRPVYAITPTHTHGAVHVLLSCGDCIRISLHCVACEARLFVTTGTPVQPHSMSGLSGLAVECRWVRCPPIIFTDVGFAPNAATLAGFCEQFGCEVLGEDMWVALPIIARPPYPLFMVCIRLIHTTCHPGVYHTPIRLVLFVVCPPHRIYTATYSGRIRPRGAGAATRSARWGGGTSSAPSGARRLPGHSLPH